MQVTSLSRIYYQHEPSDSIAAGLGLTTGPLHNMALQQQQQQLDAVHPAAVPVDFLRAAAAAAAGSLGFSATASHSTALQQLQPAAADYGSELGQPAQLQVQQQLLGVHPGAQLPSLPAAAAAAQPEVDSVGSGAAVGVATMNTDSVLCSHPDPMLGSAAAYFQQPQQQHDTSYSHAQALPSDTAAVVAAPAAAALGDGIDSCAEAVTPVSAPWTHCMAF
jgi:hypothetical protein